MFLLDTNVVSESRKVAAGRASPAVVAWLAATDPGVTFLSAMTMFELESGVVRMERRDPDQGARLRRWLVGVVAPAFQGRVLAMDAATATVCARLNAPDPASERDGWIAATALVHGLTLVTRNGKDFRGMGVRILDPWATAE
jgi:predicted nucleic acid-binding protein